MRTPRALALNHNGEQHQVVGAGPTVPSEYGDFSNASEIQQHASPPLFTVNTFDAGNGRAGAVASAAQETLSRQKR